MPVKIVMALLLLMHALGLQAREMERSLGKFQLRLGTEPSRTMAQGLVKTSRSGLFYGGLDLSHKSGWYLGQWMPKVGLKNPRQMELDSYLGYRRSQSGILGYEVGLMRYSFPRSLTDTNYHDIYAGLTYGNSSIGTAWSLTPTHTNSTLLIDMDLLQPFALDVLLKYTNHRREDPVVLDSGHRIQTFNDWSLNISRPWQGLQVEVSYSDSSLNESECSAYIGQNSHCKSVWSFRVEHLLK